MPPERVTVVHLGVDSRFRKLAPGGGGQRSSTAVRRPFILYVGTLEPRKNLDILIAAYAAVAGQPIDTTWSAVEALVITAVVLLTLQALAINRLAGIPYPLWNPIREPSEGATGSRGAATPK